MPNFCMTLSYDGTRYNGWQRQGNTPDTVQGRLETALSALLEQPVEVAGSGRTDAGVHARMQTASFRAKTDLPAPELLRRLRAQLPGDIGVLTLTEAGPRFHARLSCRGKTYVYRVWNSDTPNVFERRYVYALPQPLDTAAMQRAAALLCAILALLCGPQSRRRLDRLQVLLLVGLLAALPASAVLHIGDNDTTLAAVLARPF